MKVALVHDFLKEYGGAERVLEALHEIWPKAPVFTSFADLKGLGPHAERFKKWDIRQSWVAKIWPVKKLHSPLRFLAPWIWESFDFKGFDVVITSSSWYINRGIKVPPGTVHISYMHTPPRHLYGYQTAVEWQKYWPIRLYGQIINHFLRLYDFEVSQKVNYFLANSQETQRRIAKFYRRESTVIYPPVSMINEPVNLKIESPERSEYYLSVGRLARAKHIDLAIKACLKLKKPLVIVGTGREVDYLKSLVPKNNQQIQFVGEVADQALPQLYKNAKALLFPAEDEEFGIVPVEAMAYGVPVVAYASGGPLETILDGKTGTFFEKLTPDSLARAMTKLSRLKINPADCRKQAAKFSKERFQKEVRQFVEKVTRKTR